MRKLKLISGSTLILEGFDEIPELVRLTAYKDKKEKKLL